MQVHIIFSFFLIVSFIFYTHMETIPKQTNLFDESFDHNKEYQKIFWKKNGDEDLATNKAQENHFQNPIQ